MPGLLRLWCFTFSCISRVWVFRYSVRNRWASQVTSKTDIFNFDSCIGLFSTESHLQVWGCTRARQMSLDCAVEWEFERCHNSVPVYNSTEASCCGEPRIHTKVCTDEYKRRLLQFWVSPEELIVTSINRTSQHLNPAYTCLKYG